jgi:perosamine synthetase
MIPYGHHYIDEDDIDAVVEVLRTGMLTQGPKVHEFERAIADMVGAKYAVAVSSGTAALHLASLVAGFGAGDTVFTSTNTFVASANCVKYVGATPAFTDIGKQTLNMDVEDLIARCKKAKKVAGIIPVHFAGTSCDMKRIANVAQEYASIVIEDASHGLGGEYSDGSKIGNCKYSDMTVFSFHPVKGIAAGEGGMITTNNKHYYTELLKLRSHGIYKGNFEFPGISIGDDHLINQKDAFGSDDKLNPWYYEMQNLGFNYRITDIQSALALSQLNKIDDFIQRRREIASIYDKAFSNVENVSVMQIQSRSFSAHHIYVLRIQFEKLGILRKNFMENLFSQNIGTQVHYIPVPLHPYYQNLGFDINDYPETKSYYEEALTIPMYYKLKDEQVHMVINSILQLVNV